MSFRDRVDNIEKLRRDLQKKIEVFESERRDALRELPKKFGYSGNLPGFIIAIREAAGKVATKNKSASLRPQGKRKKSPGKAAKAKPAPKSEAITPSQPRHEPDQNLGITPPDPALINAPASEQSNVPANNQAGDENPTPVVTNIVREDGDLSTLAENPKEFTGSPDRSILVRNGLAEVPFKERLSVHLEFCNRILHTSKVPPSVWRNWRTFERELRDALKAI